MRRQQSQVTLRLGTTRGPLLLNRQPKFLRFVVTGTDWMTLDALDQLDDTPREGETVIAAVKESEGSAHIDGVRKGRRFGEWHKTTTYVPVPNPPSAEVLRDNEMWRAWALEQMRSLLSFTEGES